MNAADRTWGSRFHHEAIKLPKKIYRALSLVEHDLDGKQDDDADERNVFYVALTRAKSGVFITLAKVDRDGREVLPTQFIAGMTRETFFRRRTPHDTKKNSPPIPRSNLCPPRQSCPNSKTENF